MAEENKETTSPQDTSEGKEEKLYAGTYKTPKELEKGYMELNKKLGEQGLELGNARKDVEESLKYRVAMRPVETLLDQDKDLREVVFEKLGIKTEGGPTKQTKKGTLDVSKVQELVKREVAPLRETQRWDIQKKFEERHGIDQLGPEERKKQRAVIGATLFDYHQDGLKGIPTSVLEDRLEKAYVLANKNFIREQGEAEGRIKERVAASGAIGSIATGDAKTSLPELTAAQRKTAKAAGISEESYAKSLAQLESEIDSEGGQ